VPMVHPCTRPGCEMLTMGELCVEHERQRDSRARERLRRVLAAGAVVAAAALGAAVRTRLVR